MDEPLLSAYGRACTQPSPVSRMMSAFAGDFREGVDINLGVGYVNEATIPRRQIREALDQVIGDEQHYRTPFNYGGPQGASHLTESIRRFYIDHAVGGLTDEVLGRKQIVVGVSGATSLLEAAAGVLQPGIVITSDPLYYIYGSVLERLGYEIIAVPEDDDGIDPDDLERTIDALGDRRTHIRFIYIVTVNNPTGTVLPTPRRSRIVQIVTDLSNTLGRKVPVFFDAAYELLIHDPDMDRPQSPLLFDDLGIAYEIGTLSKILAPALRIGYMIGPASPLLKAVVQRVSDVGFSAPLTNQAIAGYLLDHHAGEQVAAVNRGYREKAVQIRRWIDQYLGPHIEHCSGGSAGFYFYLTFKQIESHVESPLFRYLSRTTGDRKIDGPAGNPAARVVYLPGAFCVHRHGRMTRQARRQLRLSYGFEQLPAIERALQLIVRGVEWAGAGAGARV